MRKETLNKDGSRIGCAKNRRGIIGNTTGEKE